MLDKLQSALIKLLAGWIVALALYSVYCAKEGLKEYIKKPGNLELLTWITVISLTLNLLCLCLFVALKKRSNLKLHYGSNPTFQQAVGLLKN